MKKILILFICFYFYQCDLNNKKPNNLISQSQLENIIFDILLLNAIEANGTVESDTILIGDEFIYQKHKVDSIQLSESFIFYMKDFDDYTAMYKRVEQRLQNVKDSINKTNTAMPSTSFQ